MPFQHVITKLTAGVKLVITHQAILSLHFTFAEACLLQHQVHKLLSEACVL